MCTRFSGNHYHQTAWYLHKVSRLTVTQCPYVYARNSSLLCVRPCKQQGEMEVDQQRIGKLLGSEPVYLYWLFTFVLS